MRILMVTSEIAPFSKTGGLADVCGALPAALASRGHEVRVAWNGIFQNVRAEVSAGGEASVKAVMSAP